MSIFKRKNDEEVIKYSNVRHLVYKANRQKYGLFWRFKRQEILLDNILKELEKLNKIK